MNILPRNVDIDYSAFESSKGPFSAKYGLPADVKFCSRCVVSNQRPNSTVEFKNTAASQKTTIQIGKDNVCDACRFAEQKHGHIKWSDREQELREICDRHRRNDGRYDCVVPGSGGKDSIYAAWLLKNKYGMHPLTVTWAPNIYTEWGWRNFQNWIHSGFDNYLLTPNGRVHRLLTRLSLEVLLHPFQPFILGQKNIGPMFARKMDIPLVFYGENEAEYGNPLGDNNSALRQAEYYSSLSDKDLHLAGTSVDDLKNAFGLTANDLKIYMPPDLDELNKGAVEVHYVGYYEKWHPQTCYYHSTQYCKFEASPERTPGTFSKYSSIDDRMDDLHFYTTFVKFGIGRATHDASQEVRSQDIERDEALQLVRRFDGEFPDRFIDELFKYLSIPADEFPVAHKMFEQPTMDMAYFEHLVDRFRSPHLWHHQNDEWQLRNSVWKDG